MTSHPPQKILIIGASARAAVQSARRAGFDVIAIDLFKDEDLRLLASECFQIADFEHDVISLVAEAVKTHGPFVGWIYTGALENRPELVDSISSQLPLLGNDGNVLTQIRNPINVHRILQREKLPVLEVRSAEDPPPQDDTWLRKPLQSAAGRDIEIWNAKASRVSPSEQYFFQKYVSDAQPISAIFVANGRLARCIGSSMQLIGEASLGADSFTYCGSIGPLSKSSTPAIPENTQQQIQRTADCLTQQCQLVGLFGIDFLLKGSVAWPIEINPRYPASLEVLEMASEGRWMADHVNVCLNQDNQPDVLTTKKPARPFVGKAVFYANQRLVIPKVFEPFRESLSQFATSSAAGQESDNVPSPQLADIPAAGTIISQGHPVCTLFTSGNSLDQCRDQLFKESRTLKKQLEV